MHVEISVALNFVISYLYNKLPRRRVDLFGEELEAGLKRKFEGHWYPSQPNKGSGYRCVKGNGDEVDVVIVDATNKAGLDIDEVKNYLPDDLTLWIDPSEVSYKIGERGQVKILYSDRKEEDGPDNTDKEVQAASRTFNPEAQSFNPEAQTFNPEAQSFTPDVLSFCTDSPQSFQPIDSLSSSLSNLSLSPSSPLPPGTWSTTTSPSSSLYNSFEPTPSTTIAAPTGYLGPKSSPVNRPQFTAATFAATKFGSTKLKSHAKRPNRLSPTEFSNFFRQQQRSTYSSPQRPRSLSPRDPRVEFMMDQQQRMMYNQHQRQHQQMSPSHPFGPQYHQNPQHQQLSPTSGLCPDFMRQHSTGISSSHSSPHLSPHLSPLVSPQSNGPTFQDLIPQHTGNQLSGMPSHHQTHQLQQPIPHGLTRPSSLSRLNRATAATNQLNVNRGFGHGPFTQSGSISQPGSLSQMNTLSPDTSRSFVDGLNMPSVNYNSNSLQHLLVAN